MTMRDEEGNIQKTDTRRDQEGGQGHASRQLSGPRDVAAIGASEVPALARREATPQELIRCGDCGADFDPAELDQVIFHGFGHEPQLATGIIGERVD